MAQWGSRAQRKVIQCLAMVYFFGLCGMGLSYVLIKYREPIGDTVGDAYWMRHVGGVYNLMVIVGVFIFFWSLAVMTGTTRILFAPLYWFFGGALSNAV